ncbi:NAD(P)-binding protein [Zopfia rhizophila CBS 207.26]|uniref:D-xylose 1-dehydrogenase (NADP(+), D-xylono-1,5-lactone-forming) n=1 Tax=Zopfia rhizophila CBS 207.26 TaxID=1314779 RepID=A0A6A6ELL4_9PEZI|nr:NAD(P)-binding protein [Zopfia rhizophila CBS 207.26]
MSSPKVIRWGILATGVIAVTFTKDLLVDPTTRGVTSIKHTVVAAASSSSVSRAESFLRRVGAPASARAYDSYQDLIADPDVDIIYIATPHSHHYQNAMHCLEAGKNVLCEKPFTVNAEQARLLVNMAKEKGCFLMEALWTRYFPLAAYVREILSSGRLGTLVRVMTDCNIATNPEKSFKDGKHRMVNSELAGGALLDLGVYSLTWPFLALYDTQPRETRKPPKVLAAMTKYPPTFCADETTTMVLTFPRNESAGGDAHAIATTSIRLETSPASDPNPPASVRIQGTLGEIQLFPCAHNPTHSKLVLWDGTVEEKPWPQPGPGKGSGWFNGFGDSINAEGEGQGMFWEADEAGFALCEGRKEGKYLGLEETVLIMEVMDETRRQGELRYPEKIETTKFPVQL